VALYHKLAILLLTTAIMMIVIKVREWSDPRRCVATIAFFSRVDNTIAALRFVFIKSLRHVV